jgi:hypothetical protein
MENQVIHAIVNAELGIRAEVKTHRKGFLVAVFDTDAEKYFPSMVIVPKLETAIAKAKHAASHFEVAV